MSTATTGGRSVTEIRDAHRLYEALLIALAPYHDESCPTTLSKDRAMCDCDVVVRALACQTVTRHRPAQEHEIVACPEHADMPVLRSLPTFVCADCRPQVVLRCHQCSRRWPCDEINAAAQAKSLTTTEEVDAFLANLPCTPADK